MTEIIHRWDCDARVVLGEETGAFHRGCDGQTARHAVLRETAPGSLLHTIQSIEQPGTATDFHPDRSVTRRGIDTGCLMVHMHRSPDAMAQSRQLLQVLRFCLMPALNKSQFWPRCCHGSEIGTGKYGGLCGDNPSALALSRDHGQLLGIR
ncbi:hypothetical protein [Algiphilus sp.]|uniref:hypothetical protein n=1 Tax=Algiphilus sp. TaxID=1872431 RepID=UPI003B526E70